MKPIIADRRALHAMPELDRDLPRTVAYLKSVLEKLSCTLSEPIPGSLCAWFDKGRESALAFRSDADALRVQEATGLDFASETPGRMHACGHDGHMAMLLELARRLDKADGPYNYLLIFQPAEETMGGAKDICESGIFEGKNIIAVFGMHIWPGLPFGKICSRANELMPRTSEITVEIKGKSAHVAKADEGIDALTAGARFLLKAKEIEADWPPHIHRLLGIGKFTSGSVRNAISDHTRIEGTLRAFQDEVFFGILDRLKRTADQIAAETGCSFEFTLAESYPPVVNPPELCKRVRDVGFDYIELEKPDMTAEDFSWYQQFRPGMFFFLGCGDTAPLHNPAFDFDESVLETGADFFERLALDFK